MVLNDYVIACITTVSTCCVALFYCNNSIQHCASVIIPIENFKAVKA